MIGHQTEEVETNVVGFHTIGQPFEEAFPLSVFREDGPPFHAAKRNVVNRSFIQHSESTRRTPNVVGQQTRRKLFLSFKG